MSSKIYLIATDCRKYCKIGITSNLENRLRAIQNGNPQKLTIIDWHYGDYAQEFTLHSKFRKFRQKGEWFLLDKSILKEFEKKSSNKLLHDNDCYMTFSDATSLGGLNRLASCILHELCLSSKYNTGLVVVDSQMRKDWCFDYDCTNQGISSSLKELLKNGIIHKNSFCSYAINPRYYFRGDLKNRRMVIDQLRDVFPN